MICSSSFLFLMLCSNGSEACLPTLKPMARHLHYIGPDKLNYIVPDKLINAPHQKFPPLQEMKHALIKKFFTFIYPGPHPASILLYYISLLSGIWNITNINSRDHLVGQLTTIQLACWFLLCLSFTRISIGINVVRTGRAILTIKGYRYECCRSC